MLPAIMTRYSGSGVAAARLAVEDVGASVTAITTRHDPVHGADRSRRG